VGAIARKSASNCVPRRLSLSGFDRLRERKRERKRERERERERKILISPQQDQVGGLGLRAQLATTWKEHGALVSCGHPNKLAQTW
jgi:hypothetical protein